MKKIQLTIPDPCHENWDQMTPQEKGRFCGSCQKTVVDFTNMSDREIAEFFKKPPSSLCGHFHQDQLERDISLPRKRIPWIKYFFRFTIPAALISTRATAQGVVTTKNNTVCTTDSSRTRDNSIEEKKHPLQGKVTNARGVGIPFAAVVVRGTGKRVSANGDGNFEIAAEIGANLEVYAIGYDTQSITVHDFSPKSISLKPAASGVVDIVVKNQRIKRKESNPATPKIIDTDFKKFSVSPNPAQNKSYLKIDCSKLENGEYIISVIDMSGEVLQTQEIVIEDKKKLVEFYLQEAGTGTYLIHLFNRKTAASYSEKVIVQ